MRIRPAAPRDVPALACVAAASYRAAFLTIIGEEGLSQRDEAFFLRRFEVEWPSVHVLDGENGAILGFAQLRSGAIDMLFLDPSAIGSGLGGLLLRDAEARGAVRLECFRDNHAARRFYERHGWRLAGEDVRDFAGAPRAFVNYGRAPVPPSEAKG